jgi:hypothetical protein
MKKKRRVTKKKQQPNEFIDKVIKGTYNFFSSPFDHPYCIACDDSGCKYCFKTNPHLEGGE